MAEGPNIALNCRFRVEGCRVEGEGFSGFGATDLCAGSVGPTGHHQMPKAHPDLEAPAQLLCRCLGGLVRGVCPQCALLVAPQPGGRHGKGATKHRAAMHLYTQ